MFWTKLDGWCSLKKSAHRPSRGWSDGSRRTALWPPSLFLLHCPELMYFPLAASVACCDASDLWRHLRRWTASLIYGGGVEWPVFRIQHGLWFVVAPLGVFEEGHQSVCLRDARRAEKRPLITTLLLWRSPGWDARRLWPPVEFDLRGGWAELLLLQLTLNN